MFVVLIWMLVSPWNKNGKKTLNSTILTFLLINHKKHKVRFVFIFMFGDCTF